MTNKFNQNISVFKNTFDKNPALANLNRIIEGIKYSSRLKALCARLRANPSSEERRKFKQISFPAITVSGVFQNGHARCNLVRPSGLMQADFDGKDLPGGVKLTDLILTLNKDPYTGIGFLSPSGLGYKVFVKVPANLADHNTHFKNLERYYKNKLNLRIDPSCKDIGRLCFLSSDESIYKNELSELFNLNEELSDYAPVTSSAQTPDILELQVLGVIRQIDLIKIDISKSYQNWLKLGFALSTALGDNGRIYFHRLSQHSPEYSHEKTDKQFSRCLLGKSEGITIRTFFGIAKSYGIDINPVHLSKYYAHGI